MEIRKMSILPAAVLLSAFAFHGEAFSAGAPRIGLMAGAEGGGEANVDLAVRQVTVAPLRTYVGEKVRVEVLIENKDEGMETSRAEVYANGKLVGHQLFTWGMSPGDRLYRLTFDWDTRGFPPGEYVIRGEAFVWRDTSPFDNHLDVGRPVLLAPPGGTFPGGAAAGGSATETDPRFREGKAGG